MKDPDSRQSARLLERQLAYTELAKIPAVLYFPPEVLDQLNELCELRGLEPGQLIAEAFKSQSGRWDAFYKEVLTPLAPGESEVWPEDPLYCLACVTMLHFITLFIEMVQHPVAFEELKAQAPADWSFSSGEEDEDDQADWWKLAPDAKHE
jgi:hypothetical protein